MLFVACCPGQREPFGTVTVAQAVVGTYCASQPRSPGHGECAANQEDVIVQSRIRSAVFLDLDNLFSGLLALEPAAAMEFVERPGDWLAELASRGVDEGQERDFIIRRCYLNPAGSVVSNHSYAQNGRLYLSKFRPFFTRAGFEVIDCPALTAKQKNAADIRIALDVVDIAYGNTLPVDEYVIGSSDADFTPLVQRLRARDRRVVVMATGNTSFAYRSLATDYLDETACIDLLTRAEDEAASGAGAGEVPREATVEDLHAFARQALADSESGEVLLSALGVLARKQLGDDVGGRNWFGYGNLTAALGAGGIRCVGHLAYDPVRSNAMLESLPQSIRAVAQVSGMPTVPQAVWPLMFRTLSEHVAREGFGVSTTSIHTRDRMVELGRPVGRNAVNWVIRGVMYGGASLSDQPAPTPDQLAGALFRNVINQCESAGLPLAETEVDELASWLGHTRVPGSEPVAVGSGASSEAASTVVVPWGLSPAFERDCHDGTERGTQRTRREDGHFEP